MHKDNEALRSAEEARITMSVGCRRCEENLSDDDALAQYVEVFRGQFYNWIATQTDKPEASDEAIEMYLLALRPSDERELNYQFADYTHRHYDAWYHETYCERVRNYEPN